MALPSILIADFIGEIRISQDQYGQEQAQDFIDEKYPELLRQVLGDYAYTEILDTDPLPEKWEDVMNGKSYTDAEGVFRICEGLTKALKYWLYCELLRDGNFIDTPTGTVANYNENSARLTGGALSTLLATRYNKGCNMVVNAYLLINNYELISEEVASVTDNADNTYTFDVNSTLYLAVGDEVACNGLTLTVTAIVDDTSITADAGTTGLTFSGEISWQPFEKYDIPLHLPIKSSSI